VRRPTYGAGVLVADGRDVGVIIEGDETTRSAPWPLGSVRRWSSGPASSFRVCPRETWTNREPKAQRPSRHRPGTQPVRRDGPPWSHRVRRSASAHSSRLNAPPMPTGMAATANPRGHDWFQSWCASGIALRIPERLDAACSRPLRRWERIGQWDNAGARATLQSVLLQL
jgi:hypothetical protein